MNRRFFLTLALLALMALVAVGCAAPAAAPSAADAPASDADAATESDGSGDQTELRIAWWGSQNRHDRTIAVIELFEELHPEIDVVYEFSSWTDHWTKMATQAAGGNLPDIMQQDYARLEEWVDRDLIMPLDQFVEDGALDFTNVSDAALDGGRIDGQLYGVNLGTNSLSFVIDLDAFEAAGIEVPAQDWTWQDFEETAMALHEATGGYGHAFDLSNEQLWKSLYLSNDEWAYSDDGTALGYEDDAIFADYIDMILRLQEAGAIPNIEEENARGDQGVEASLIVTQDSPMDMFWSNQIVAVQTAAGEDRNLYMNHLPRLEGGQSANYVKPSMFFSITSQAKEPEAAAMFIDFFTNNVDANNILFAERGVPVSSEIREALKPQLDKAQLEMFDFLDRVVADSSPIRPPDPVGHADIINNIYFPEAIDPTLYGQMDSAQAVEILREQASEILAQNAE